MTECSCKQRIATLEEALASVLDTFPADTTLDALDDDNETGMRPMILQRHPTIKEIRGWRSVLAGGE